MQIAIGIVICMLSLICGIISIQNTCTVGVGILNISIPCLLGWALVFLCWASPPFMKAGEGYRILRISVSGPFIKLIFSQYASVSLLMTN